eukprot:4050591-Pyramimonas_sp.AAC.1
MQRCKICNYPVDVPNPCATRDQNSWVDFLGGEHVAWRYMFCVRDLGGSRAARLAGHRSMDKGLMELIS